MGLVIGMHALVSGQLGLALGLAIDIGLAKQIRNLWVGQRSGLAIIMYQIIRRCCNSIKREGLAGPQLGRCLS